MNRKMNEYGIDTITEKESSSCSRSWIQSLGRRRGFWWYVVTTTGGKFESEFSKCFDQNSFRNWFIDDCRKERSFFIHKVWLLITCSRDYWSSAQPALVWRGLTWGILIMVIGRSNHSCYLFTWNDGHVNITDDHIETWSSAVKMSRRRDVRILPIVEAKAWGPSSTQIHLHPILVRSVSRIYKSVSPWLILTEKCNVPFAK